eukprot:1429261-Pyramimonas_sp.AAC.1
MSVATMISGVHPDSLYGLPKEKSFLGKRRERFPFEPRFKTHAVEEQYGTLIGVVDPIENGARFLTEGKEEVVASKCSYPGCCVCVGEPDGPDINTCSRAECTQKVHLICQGHAEYQRDVDAGCEILCFTHLVGLLHEQMRQVSQGALVSVKAFADIVFWSIYLLQRLLTAKMEKPGKLLPDAVHV